MKRMALWLVAALLLAPVATADDATESLLDARKGHVTQLSHETSDDGPLEPPPPQLFTLVEYPTSIGAMSAYLGNAPAPSVAAAIPTGLPGSRVLGRFPAPTARVMKADLAAAGIERVTDAGHFDFHSLRHGFISGLAALGLGVADLKDAARHSDISTTQRYLHSDASRIADAVARHTQRRTG